MTKKNEPQLETIMHTLINTSSIGKQIATKQL